MARRLSYLIPLAVIAALSLGLLTYLGFGEARRTYTSLATDKLAAQGEIVRTAMDTFLLAGLPLQQFPGFTTVSRSVLDSDTNLSSLYVVDPNGRVVFANTPPGGVLPVGPFAPPAEQSTGDVSITENSSVYQANLGLRNKIESVGELRITVPRSIIETKISDAFLRVALAAAALVVIFCLVGLYLLGVESERGERRLAIAFVVTFVAMALIVIATLTSLYVTGIQAKSQSLAQSLYVRLEEPLRLGLDLNDFSQLDQTFDDYRKRNPDISFVALTQGNRVLVQTTPHVSGDAWAAPSAVYESDLTLVSGPTAHAAGVPLRIRVGVPKTVVYGKLWQSAKNFAALFVASMLLSTVFFNLRRAFARHGAAQRSSLEARRDLLLGLIGPLYFVIVFADCLNNSFLPQHFRDVAIASQVGSGMVATLFTTWFAAYGLALLPTGILVDRIGVKPLFLVGALLSAANLFLLAVVRNFSLLILTQAIDGIGQGIVFIGVQSYIFQVTSARKRTQGGAIIVFGYNGGVIAGTAIGSLLAVDPSVGQNGVFVLGGALCLAVVLYTLILIPSEVPAAAASPANPESQTTSVPLKREVQAHLWRAVGQALSDRTFALSSLLVGIPTKIVMAGVISASLPLILTQQRYNTADIGQILMFYSGGVLIASRAVSRLADRRGNTGGLLLLGLLASGIGLFLAGLIGWHGLANAYLATVLLVCGMAILGIGHGFIQAPILTHVAGTPTASRLGQSFILSLYRLVERLGNISGPIIVSQVLIANHGSPLSVSIIGEVLLVFAGLFLVSARRLSRPMAAVA